MRERLRNCSEKTQDRYEHEFEREYDQHTQPAAYSVARRSLRIWLTMPIRVSRNVADRLHRTVETSPLAVNAHGALILLSKEVQGDKLNTLRCTNRPAAEVPRGYDWRSYRQHE